MLDEIAGAFDVEIVGTGSSFELHGAALDSVEWQPPTPGYRYIWLRSKETEPPALPLVLDYEGERDKRDVRRKWERVKPKGGEAELEAQGLGAPEEPHPDFPLASILASIRSGWWGDQDLAKWIAADPERALRWVRAALSDQPFPEAPSISNSQILNPISGKGVHAAKTESRSAGSLPTALIDSFAEWMKLRGLWLAALAYRVDDDFKIYVLEPQDISVNGLRHVRDTLRRRNLWGSVRLDIEATLRCAETLIRHSEAYQDEESEETWAIFGKSPRDLIAGLRLAYFKSLGSAAALMNDSLLPVPDWFHIQTSDDARAFVTVIGEAIGEDRGRTGRRTYGCLASLQEQNSDDGAILQQFREWLLTGSLAELLQFHSRFAVHLMERLGAGEFARPFSTTYLDTLLVRAYDMSFQTQSIVTNAGFISVARALRNSTIYAAQKVTRVDVRFGLAQRWKQRIKTGKAAFLAELSEFVQEYNWEVIHSLGGAGHVIKTEDLDEIVALVDTHTAELVGSLLLAYGYARAPKTQVAEPELAAALSEPTSQEP